ncbi:hypothetical protein B0H14DRAFT_3652111 [Mycena olivaceomarginata]|nr:hypothetical protein B0H14DRAFT_3652111 [Mycena olivaceomarginata]
MKLNFLWPREVFVATFTVRGSAVSNAEESRCDSMVRCVVEVSPNIWVTETASPPPPITLSAGYFSNHSAHSRFLAISASASSSATSPPAALPQAPNSTPTTASNAQIAGKAPGGWARSTSKHFSTSVEAHGHGHGHGDEEEDGAAPLPSVHPLRNTWVFRFRQQRTPGNKIVSYEDGIKRVAAFSSVRLFKLYISHSRARRSSPSGPSQTHLAPPSALAPTTDYLLFHVAVQRPVWEDPLNLTGGKWIIRLRKGVADHVWEALVCAVAGEAFAGCGAPAADEGARESWEDDDSHAEAGGEGTDDAPEICGCTISVRQSEDIISLWNRVDDVRVRERIRDTLRTVLGLPAATVMEYKSNNACVCARWRSWGSGLWRARALARVRMAFFPFLVLTGRLAATAASLSSAGPEHEVEQLQSRCSERARRNMWSAVPSSSRCAWQEAGVVVVVVGQRNAVAVVPDAGTLRLVRRLFERAPFGEESGTSGERGCPCRWLLRAGEGKNGTSGKHAGDTDAPEICKCMSRVRGERGSYLAVEPRARAAAPADGGACGQHVRGGGRPSEMDVVPRGPPERMQQRLRTPDDLMPRQLAAEGEEEEEAGEDGEREGGGGREAGREERERQRGHKLFCEREESRMGIAGPERERGLGVWRRRAHGGRASWLLSSVCMLHAEYASRHDALQLTRAVRVFTSVHVHTKALHPSPT